MSDEENEPDGGRATPRPDPHAPTGAAGPPGGEARTTAADEPADAAEGDGPCARAGAGGPGSAAEDEGPDAPATGDGGLRELLVGLLQGEDGPGVEDLADVVWLARLARGQAADRVAETGAGRREAQETGGETGAPAGSMVRSTPVTPPRDTDVLAEPPTSEEEAPGRQAAPPRVGLHSFDGGGDGPRAAAAHVVQVAQPPALAGALDLARALRPLRQSVDSAGPALLDEDATAQATGEAGRLIPVRRAASERRFSVDLLVDTGATMAVWHRLAAELCTLLERHGAFAAVRCWSLDTDQPVPRLAPFHRRPAPASRPRAADPARWAAPLADPGGRSLLLVLTDGVGPAWYGSALTGFLARVAAERPAAALQVLPRRLWHRTALRTAPVELRIPDPARPVPEFRTASPVHGLPRGDSGSGGLRWLPVMEVDAHWLAPWAGLIAGRSPGWSAMRAAPVARVPRPRRTPPARAEAAADGRQSPAGRVARLRAGCSPEAFRLACHLAAAPLSLPVMRLVQRATVPESGQTDLAEVFLSGIIERRSGRAAGTDPDEVVYDFATGVRAELLAELTRTESLHVLDQVLARVSGRVAATFGGTLDFRALAALADTATEAGRGETGGRVLPAASLPFAEVAVAVLSGAGGQHRELARRLADAAEGRSTAGGGPYGDDGPGAVPTSRPLPHPEFLLPVPPVEGGPEAGRSGADFPGTGIFVGREAELAALAAALRTTIALPYARPVQARPSVAVVEGAPGTGRRRLVQEYIRRHGHRHGFVHWIDARDADSLAAGLNALADALGAPPQRSTPGVWELLAGHRHWLLVLDGLPAGLSVGDFAPQLPPYGEGSVVMTTDDMGSGPSRFARITLGNLSRAEITAHLRTILGQRMLAAADGRPGLLDAFVRGLPTLPSQLAQHDLIYEFAVELDASPGRPGSRPQYRRRGATPFRSVAGYVAHSGLFLAAVDQSGAVWRLDPTATGRSGQARLFGSDTSAEALTVFTTHDGRLMAATATGGSVSVHDLASGATLWTDDDGEEDVAALTTFVPYQDGRVLLVALGNTIRFWDAASGAVVSTVLNDQRGITGVTFYRTSGGQAVAVLLGSRQRHLRLLDAFDGTPVDSPLANRVQWPTALATVRIPERPDLLAASGPDGLIRLWDTSTGDFAGTLGEPSGALTVSAAAYTDPAGRQQLATVTDDGEIRVFDVLEAVDHHGALGAAQSRLREEFPDLFFAVWLVAELDADYLGIPREVLDLLLPAELRPAVDTLLEHGLLMAGHSHRVLLPEQWPPAEFPVLFGTDLLSAPACQARLLQILDEICGEPTEDPDSWRPYQVLQPVLLPLGRAVTWQGGESGHATTETLGLLSRLARFHLLRGDPSLVERIAGLADVRLLVDRPEAPGELPGELAEASLRALVFCGAPQEIKLRCHTIASSGTASQELRAQAELADAHLSWCQGQLDAADVSLRSTMMLLGLLAPPVLLPLAAVHAARHVAARLSERSTGRWFTPTDGLNTPRPGRVEPLLPAGLRALPEIELALAHDQLTAYQFPGLPSTALPLLEAARWQLWNLPSGFPSSLREFAAVATNEHFDVYLSLTEMFVSALALDGSGPMWGMGQAGLTATPHRRPDPRVARCLKALRPHREPLHTTRPHAYAAFRAVEGFALAMSGFAEEAETALAAADETVTDLYGPKSPLLPPIMLHRAYVDLSIGGVRAARNRLSAAEGLLDALYRDRPQQDRVLALRARAYLAASEDLRAEATERADRMTADLLGAADSAPEE